MKTLSEINEELENIQHEIEANDIEIRKTEIDILRLDVEIQVLNKIIQPSVDPDRYGPEDEPILNQKKIPKPR